MRLKLMTGTIWSTVALTAAFASTSPAFAQVPPVQLADNNRDTVTITATRTERQVDEVAATVTVISDKTIEDELATDIKDLVRFEPGVSVRNSPGRFSAALSSTGRDGNSGFNIRGLEGNRVLIQVDGVRVPDSYSFGAQAQGRGEYVDLDLLKSVEILRGPASALYGSDGVAGAVSFITRDPSDLVKEGRAFGLRARSAYASADDSIANSVIGATELGDWSALIAYTSRTGHEQKNQGENEALNANRTAPNPTDYFSNSYLGKLVWAPSDAHRFRLTYDRLDRNMKSEVYSARAVIPAGTSAIDLDAKDDSGRERLAFDHVMEFGEGFFKSAQWSAYTQDSTTRQLTWEDRLTSPDRIRDTTFDNKVWGLNGQVEGGFVTGPATHALLFGADYSSTEQGGVRTGTIPPAGETFPSRAFPNTDYELAGVFVQDEISLLNGQLLLYPALRYDSYELTPKRDALYSASLPATASDGSRVSPKFGVVAWPVDWIGAFFNYASGYKAPSPSQVNNGFSNPLQNYTSIANADLKPETSESLEVGLRTRNLAFLGADWSGNVTAYASDYEDFIEQVLVRGAFMPTNPAVYQYVNLTNVEISGLEARIDAAWSNGLGVTAAASRTDGDFDTGGARTPLQSVDPLKFVAGVSYRDPAGHFGGQLVATYSDKKDVRDVSATGTTTLFLPQDFTILDLTAYWNITDYAAVRVGAFNLTDEKYWWWSDVRGVGATSTTLDAYTQTGRNYSASLTLRY